MTIRWLSWPLIGLVYLYRIVVSPLIRGCCRFYPSCSSYCIQALKTYGPMRGSWLTIKRIIKCRSGCPGGFDPVSSSAPGRKKRNKWKKTQFSR